MSREGSGRWRLRAVSTSNKLAGRYQGYHWFPDKPGSFEIFWRANGWWWWLRVPGCLPAGEAVGPFLKSTDAYLNASGGAVEKVSPLRIRVGLDPKAP